MKNLFSKKQIAGLLNDAFSNVYRLASVNIAEQRDANLSRLSGESVNNTELAMATLGDAQVTFCYDRLMEYMSSFNYYIESEDENIKEFLEEQILEQRELIYESLALAKITGVAAFEVIWGKSRGLIMVEDYIPVDSRRILYEIPNDHYKPKLRVTTRNNVFQGVLVEPTKIVDYQFYSAYINSSYGLGVGGLLSELVEKKNLVESIWFEIAKKYSQPIKVGTVPETASDEEVDNFFSVLKDMKNSATFILPSGFELDVTDISGSGSESIVQPLLDYYDEKISSLLLGESITGRELSNGSQTRDIVANDIAVQKAYSLAKGITTRLNKTLVKWLIAYNFPGAEAKIVVQEPQNLAELLDGYEQLQRLGVRFDPNELATKFDVTHVDVNPLGINFNESDNTAPH